VIQKLTLQQILKTLGTTPEQAVFDWKRTFAPPRDESDKGEFVKDVMAVANATAYSRSLGFMFYGVNPDAPDPVVGIDARWDDNEAQALVRSALAPMPELVYYEVDAGRGRWIGVVHIAPCGGFFIASRDVGRLREGQCVIRQGSVTRGVTRADHIKLYLTPGYGYAEQLLQHYNVTAQLMNARTGYLQQNQATHDALLRQMEAMSGLPRGSLG
jgi:Schlafen, AlbA_2